MFIDSHMGNVRSRLLFTLLVLVVFPGVVSWGEIVCADEAPPVHPWGYEGGIGPEHWGEMDHVHENHLMCREGARQSPINIDHVPGLKLDKLSFHYLETPLLLINNKHTLLLRYKPGSFVEWEGEKFELIQVHFHHPSEHQVNGKSFPMEIHLVHKTEDHQYIVIAVFAKYGDENKAIQRLWAHVPSKTDEEILVSKQLINARTLLPETKNYYFYDGSLTTPPCTENVTWFILEEPVEMSRGQVELFQRIFKENARPIQKLNHRLVVRLKQIPIQ